MKNHSDIYSTSAAPIPPSKYPNDESGPVLWLRKNLFGSVFDGILSLIGIAIILFMVAPFVEWALLNAVWHAESYDACREIIIASHGKDARGACWGFLDGRVGTLFFGLYPPELYWRPSLALALIALALVPVPVRALRRKTLWLSAFALVIAFKLVIGGSGLEVVDYSPVGGFLVIIMIAVYGTMAALMIGIVLSFGQHFLILPLRAICSAISGFFRRIPLFVLLFSSILGIYFLPFGAGPAPLVWFAGIMAFHSGSYLADAIGVELKTMPDGQWEAASALGLGSGKSICLVILPQILRRTAPQIARTSVGLLRDTAILSMTGVLLLPLQFAKWLSADGNWHEAVWEVFLLTGVSYWVLCYPISCYAGHLERSNRHDNHHAISRTMNPRAVASEPS